MIPEFLVSETDYTTRPSTVASIKFFRGIEAPESKPRVRSSRRKLLTSYEREKNLLVELLPERVFELSESLAQGIGDKSGDNNHYERVRARYSAAVFSRAPSYFQSSFKSLFSTLLKQQQSLWNDDEEEDIMGFEIDRSHEELFTSLRYLGWIPRLLHRSFSEALHIFVVNYLEEKIKGEYEEEHLDEINVWKENLLIPWVRHVLGNEEQEKHKLEWDKILDYTVSECFCNVRMKEIFEIVADFPDSYVAVQELRQALDHTRMYDTLADKLRTSLKRRLIHPGANTSQIIDVYINTIKVLRVIDPADSLLEKVTQPVRSYLRSRSDTVRCIVTSLTDEEEGGDLYEELRREGARPLENNAQSEYSDDEDYDDMMPPDPNWLPAPKHNCFSFPHLASHNYQQSSQSNGNNKSDILSMLVGIYGTKEIFVNEYRIMLVDKLLSNLDYNTNKEVHNLELLKLRFGDSSMRQCEVMIKDIDDSKRIISNIHSTIKSENVSSSDDDNDQQNVVDAAIVSHTFWPPLQKDQMKIHPRIQAGLDQFSKEYAKFKNPRRLAWLPQIGTVEIEIEFEEEVVISEGDDENNDDGDHQKPTEMIKRTKEFTCSPIHATLITYFEDKDTWTVDELVEITKTSKELVLLKMQYWINHKVMKFVSSGMFYELTTRTKSDELGSNSGEGNEGEKVFFEDDEGEKQQAFSAGKMNAETMQIYESYIMGMLANLGASPLEKIHNMLKLVGNSSDSLDHNYDMTPRQLSIFLSNLCRENKLECGADGFYNLVKK